MNDRITVSDAKIIIQNMTDKQRDAIAVLTETFEPSGDYSGMDESGGSYWEDDAMATLNDLAAFFRNLK